MDLFSIIIILKIMQLAHIDEHEQLASHVTPGHALSVGQPLFFLSRDAVNFAALDYLVGLTGKVRVLIIIIMITRGGQPLEPPCFLRHCPTLLILPYITLHYLLYPTSLTLHIKIVALKNTFCCIIV